MTFCECQKGGKHMENMEKTKFCKHCGAKIPFDAIVCTACGCQVEELKSSQQESPQIVINNANSNVKSQEVNCKKSQKILF